MKQTMLIALLFSLISCSTPKPQEVPADPEWPIDNGPGERMYIMEISRDKQ